MREVDSLLGDLPLLALKTAWSKYIIAPVQGLLDFDDAIQRFQSIINEFFAAYPVTSRAAFAYFPSHLRTPIMQAGAESRLIRLTYDGVRRDVERPWRHACGIGLLAWWLILFAIFFTMTVGYLCLLPTLPPDDGQGPMSPGGSLGIIYLLLSCSEGVYGVCATPFLLLGVAMSYPRRERQMRAPPSQ